MARKCGFKLTPGGLDARAPKKLRDYNPLGMKPTDKAQYAPTEAKPMRARHQRAGGC
jgi:hypothetical protein